VLYELLHLALGMRLPEHNLGCSRHARFLDLIICIKEYLQGETLVNFTRKCPLYMQQVGERDSFLYLGWSVSHESP